MAAAMSVTPPDESPRLSCPLLLAGFVVLFFFFFSVTLNWDVRGNRCSRYLEFLRCSPGSVFLHLLCPINVLVQLAPATLEEFKAFMPHGQKKKEERCLRCTGRC